MRRAQGGLAALAAVLAIAAVIGTEAGQAAGDKSEDGYTSLFNGKDLTGWRYPGAKGEVMDGKTETPDKRIQVVDGIIVVNAKDAQGKGGIRDLYTARQFDKNFHLKLEFRAAPRADSGLYIRGPQLQVRDYPTVGPYKPKGFKTGDWNELDVTVKAGVVATTANGKAVTDKDVLEVTVKDGKPTARLNGTPIDVNNIQITVGPAALCKCNGEVIEQAMKVPAKGGIGLQAETGKFEFRNIRVKELD